MLITLWELIGVWHSSPPSSVIRWVCKDSWKRRQPGGHLPPLLGPSSAGCDQGAKAGFEILKPPSCPSPWCPKTHCCFCAASSLCHFSPNFFSSCLGETGPGRTEKWWEVAPLWRRKEHPPQSWPSPVAPGHPLPGLENASFSFSCSPS